MKKSIVTGGAGFIGSHIVDRLIADGHEVYVIDDESAECNEEFFYNPKAKYFKISIEDYNLIEPLFKGASYVFHLAAESRIQPTLERPQKACLTNFVGTCNVLQAARHHAIKRVVYSSTSSVYGLKNKPPLNEGMERDCLNPYSVSKVAAEDLCKMYHSLWGLETVILRYFNIYGERQPIKGQYAPVIGIFQRQKRDGEKHTIVGTGKQRRDFTHVSDAVEANILAATAENKTLPIAGEIFNVGSGKNHSILEVSAFIGGPYTFVPPRPGEAETTLANISKINVTLNYNPKTSLEDWVNLQNDGGS